MPYLVLFLASASFSILGAFNRFSFAPLLCAFLILGFPAIGGVTLPDKVPILLTLIAQVPAFGYGLRGFVRLRCVDWELVRRFVPPATAAAVLGGIVASAVPSDLRLAAWALLLLAVVGAWWVAPAEPPEQPEATFGAQVAGAPGHLRRLVTAEGVTYVYACTRQEIGVLLTSVGAFITGLTSFGLGEVETANFAARCRIPTRVAVGTGLAIAFVATLAAAGTHLVLLAATPRLGDLPWLLPVVASTGAVGGSAIGRRLARLVPSDPATRSVHLLLGAAALWVLLHVLVRP